MMSLVVTPNPLKQLLHTYPSLSFILPVNPPILLPQIMQVFIAMRTAPFLPGADGLSQLLLTRYSKKDIRLELCAVTHCLAMTVLGNCMA